MGRPNQYTQQIADTICERLLEQNLVKICRAEDMPSRATVYRWMDEHPDFKTRCARAREGLVEFKLAEAEDILDRVLNDKLDPAAARVAISHIEWMAEKVASKQYGNRLALTDGDGKPLLTDEERLARLTAMLDKARDRLKQDHAESGGA